MLENPETWVAIAFVVTVILIVWKGGRSMMKTLDDRAEAVRAELDAAEKLREEAQHMLADYQRRQRDAIKESEAIIAQARTDAEALIVDSRSKLEETLSRREQLALDRIAQAEANAQTEIRAQAAQMVIAASRQILAKQLDGAPGDALVDGAIKDLPKHLH
ncbi:MAG: F0F1 ATP synthase subunit B [Alphaproteobacteria bacterium]